MIVCVCLGVSDRKVLELAKQGVNYRELIAKCQAGTNCGSCSEAVKELFHQCCSHGSENKKKKTSARAS